MLRFRLYITFVGRKHLPNLVWHLQNIAAGAVNWTNICAYGIIICGIVSVSDVLVGPHYLELPWSKADVGLPPMMLALDLCSILLRFIDGVHECHTWCLGISDLYAPHHWKAWDQGISPGMADSMTWNCQCMQICFVAVSVIGGLLRKKAGEALSRQLIWGEMEIVQDHQ